MRTLVISFLLAAVATSLVIALLVYKMINQLRRVLPTEDTIFPWSRLPKIIREHNRLFPHSHSMLGFWLLLVYLVTWLAGVAFSLTHDL